ncbi:MAG: deoxyribodipyrimidine photo-lyase [Sneathiella sp.]|nr:deoxyribodipyrimidine photo-lyase [Sneathiella sp.]
MSKPSSHTAIALHWFRQNLRLSDNPALTAAVCAEHIIPFYILDDENAGRQKMGGATRWWLHHPLTALNQSLNGRLLVFRGDARAILGDLVKRTGAETVSWTRCYEPWRISRDQKIKNFLVESGVKIISSNGSLLWEPWEISKSDGTPYRVFTPFYRKGCMQGPAPRQPLKPPSAIKFADTGISALSIEALDLLPKERWDIKKSPGWMSGESGAKRQLHAFLDHGLTGYKAGRDIPSLDHCSHLSPHLHFGEISPNQVWHALSHMEGQAGGSADIVHFRNELGWREFSYNLLYHNPELPTVNLQSRFVTFLGSGKMKLYGAGREAKQVFPS